MDSLRNNDTTTTSHPSERQPQRLAGPPTRCGCGFFGSEANNGLCSKCFNDYLKEKIVESEAIILSADPVDIPVIPKIDELADVVKSWGFIQETKNETVSAPFPVVVKNRCGSCNKKVGLLGFSCRCDGTFCGLHRYPEAHTCEIDFKTDGKIRIEKENPVCVADRIEYRA